MFRAALQTVHVLRVIFLCFVLLPEPGCRSADADSCHEVKTAYMMRQIGPEELVPDRPGTDESLQVCLHPGPTCCTSKMEDSYMAAVRSETQQKMQSYSFELKYLIAGQTKAFQETFGSLVTFTSNLTSTLFDSAYSALAFDCHPLVFQLFSDIKHHLSGDPKSSLDTTVRQFYNDLFPLVYRRLLNPGIGHMSSQIYSSASTSHDDCLRLTRQDVSPFGPHPKLLVGISELGGPWGSLVALLQRLAATLATSSNHNNMELALLAVRNHVNDAILHAQLHGPLITATVEKVCGPLAAGPVMMSSKPTTLHVTASVASATSVTSERSSGTSLPSVVPAANHSLQLQPRRLFPLKGSRAHKSRSLKKLSREFEGSIQRYQWFFSELPEMLCESEMDVDQHTCWNGQDVVESYAGPVVGSTVKAQRENPEMTVRNTDPVLKAAKQRLEQLTQELLVELGWASKGRGSRVEDEEGGSGHTDRGSGDGCDDEDGCEASGNENGHDTGSTSSGRSPQRKNMAPPPNHPVPPRHLLPPQVRSSAHTMTVEPLPLTLMTLLPLLLSTWEPR
ncbi:glypican-5-like isoform X2 [Channa argus]|uniref:glypican-5-like isoform X2 n=1 Tax=Channa argus TaxID=215402 RepID=UPI0035227038